MILQNMRNTDQSPCLNCPDRWVNETGRCHSTCEKYIAFAEQAKTKTRLINDERKRTLLDPLRVIKTPAKAEKIRRSRKR